MPKNATPQAARVLALGDVEPAAEILKILGHPHRLMIVCALMKGERAVSELERELAIRQPSLSQHLGSLRDAGVIAPRRHAKSVIYRISDPRVAPIIVVLRSVFDPSHTVAGPGDPAPTTPMRETDVDNRVVPGARIPREAAFFARVNPRATV